ncbi:MAG: rod-binding protein [Planctomycetota bacterium]
MISPLTSTDRTAVSTQPPSEDATREAFGDFVGQTLFGSMLASMRESVGTPAYFHGGRTEEVFQKQLDQHLVEQISDASSDTVVDPMYELFQLQRRG